ncbi:MAG: glutamate racemase [Magnetococcales bacterium]|nr:glutamate racemase [Magnetococcales bacterium]
MNLHDPRPIGIFDSGVGGLTVLQALLRRFPHENFIYLGDTARVPYGSKSARTVERYTIQVADFLLRRGVKALVVACNTASALGLAALRAHTATPALGVIVPGCRMALAHSQPGETIGVIGTRSTIASGAYPHTLSLLDPTVKTFSLPCPLFVPLAEEGWVRHPATRLIVAESLESFRQNPPAALILGCTHYPLLIPAIRETMGEGVRLVDSAEAVAEELSLRFQDVIPPAPPDHARQVALMVTDVADRFREVAARFLDGFNVDEVEMVDL